MSNADKPVLLTYRWVILAMTMVAGFAGSYAQSQLPPPAYKLIPALHLSSSQYAALMSGPMIGAIFISILGGSLADRYGVKHVITVGLVFAVIGCTFRYAVTSFWPFLLMMILGGLASALLTSNLAKLFGAWFPPAIAINKIPADCSRVLRCSVVDAPFAAATWRPHDDIHALSIAANTSPGSIRF